MKLDFKHFKKVGSDNKSTTLKHADGHTIVIAHAPLHPKTMKELQSLPTYDSGGKVKDTVPEPNKKNAEDMQKGATSGGPSFDEAFNNIKKGLGYAKGGNVNPKLAESKKQPPMPHYADGTDDVEPASEYSGVENQAPAEAAPMAEAAPTEASAPAQPPAGDVSAPPQGPMQGPENNPDAIAESAPAAALPASATPKRQPASVQKQGQAVAETETPPNLASPNASDAAYYAPENVKASLSAEDLAWQHALATGKVTPETYGSLFAGKDTLGKIGMLFGTLLGAVGSGGHGNAYLQMMNQEINRDLEAQHNTKMNAQNYLRLTQQAEMNKAQIAQLAKQGNLTDAQARGIGSEVEARSYALAQSKMLQASYKHLVDKTSGMPEGPDKQKAQMVLSQIYSKIGEKINDINDQAAGASAYTGAMFGLSGGQGTNNIDPSILVSRFVPEHHQKAVFDEIQRAQDTRRMSDTILKSFDQAATDNTVMRTGAGMLRTPASVLAFHQGMQPTFKDLEGTVRQAAMDNTFHNLTPRPGDANATVATKRAALQDYLKSKMSAPTAKGFGIDLDRFASTQPTANAPQIAIKDGVKYQKVVGGWQKIQ